MASKASIAARHATAAERVNAAMARLADLSGVPLPAPAGQPPYPDPDQPPPAPVVYRQSEMRAAAEAERVAAFMERLAGTYGGAADKFIPPSEPVIEGTPPDAPATDADASGAKGGRLPAAAANVPRRAGGGRGGAVAAKGKGS